MPDSNSRVEVEDGMVFDMVTPPEQPTVASAPTRPGVDRPIEVRGVSGVSAAPAATVATAAAAHRAGETRRGRAEPLQFTRGVGATAAPAATVEPWQPAREPRPFEVPAVTVVTAAALRSTAAAGTSRGRTPEAAKTTAVAKSRENSRPGRSV